MKTARGQRPVLARFTTVFLALLLGACTSSGDGSTSTRPEPEEPDAAFDWLAVIDRTREESRVSIRTEVAPGRLGTGTVLHNVYDLDLPAAWSAGEWGGKLQEEIFVDRETGWVRMAAPAFANSLPEWAQYVEAPTASLAGWGLVNLEPDRTMALLYALAGASATEPMDERAGRATYSVAIDPVLLSERIPERLIPHYRAVIGDLLDPNRATAINATVELDRDGRIAVLLIEAPSPRPEIQPDLYVQMELSGFGEPVVLDLPTPDTVIHLDEVPNLVKTLEIASSTLRYTGGQP